MKLHATIMISGIQCSDTEIMVRHWYSLTNAIFSRQNLVVSVTQRLKTIICCDLAGQHKLGHRQGEIKYKIQPNNRKLSN
jgi:hypothetical protein